MQNVVDENSLVINIRRGDYYSVPQINEFFGIDTVTYVEEALKKLQDTVTPSRIILYQMIFSGAWITSHT